MGIGSAFAAGYGSGAQSLRDRSYLPVINSMSSIINQQNRGRGVSIAPSGPSRTDTRSAMREQREREDAMLVEEKARYTAEQERIAAMEAQRIEQQQAEEARRQQGFETDIAGKQQAMEQSGEKFSRATAQDDRTKAYEMLKQGLMAKNPKALQEAFTALLPQGSTGEDQITATTDEQGVKKFTGRPSQTDIPQFIFDPDSDAVGVIFPGQKKPTVFKNVEQVFKNVIAPMNPAHEKSKDQIAEAKNRDEIDVKRKTLNASIHKDAHAAAMKQFEADGYFQPALFDQEKYDQLYSQYVEKATTGEGAKPKAGLGENSDKNARKAPKGIYKGEKAPDGFPNARRSKNGGWYVKQGKGWAPVIESGDGGQGGEKPKKKTINPPRTPMQGAGIGTPRKKVETPVDSPKAPIPKSEIAKTITETPYKIDDKTVFQKGSTLMVEDPPGKYRELNDDEVAKIGRIIKDTDVRNSPKSNLRFPKVGPITPGQGLPKR